MKYPTRCKIVDVTGMIRDFGDIKIPLRTPEESKPHIGKEGLAEKTGKDVRITLDDGTVIFGYECWWKAIK